MRHGRAPLVSLGRGPYWNLPNNLLRTPAVAISRYRARGFDAIRQPSAGGRLITRIQQSPYY